MGDPGTRWPGIIVVAPILVIVSYAAIPVLFVAMLPVLVSIKRIVATVAGLKGERGVEAGLVVLRGIVVPEIVVLIARSQEEVIGKHAHVDR